MPVKRIVVFRIGDPWLVFSKYCHVGAGTALDINDQFQQLHDMAYRTHRFVASTAAPVAFDRSESCRVGFAPAEKQ